MRWVNSVKRKLRGHLRVVYSYLIRVYREDGARLFLEVHSDTMRDNRH